MEQALLFHDYRTFTHSSDRISHLDKDKQASYLITGLVSEVAEVAEAYNDTSNQFLLIEELSDVLWYITRLSSQFNYDIEKIYLTAKKKIAGKTKKELLLRAPLYRLIIESGKIAGHYKKMLRDNSPIDPKDRNRFDLIEESLVKMVRSVLEILKLETDLTIYQVLFINKRKLEKRLGLS